MMIIALRPRAYYLDAINVICTRYYLTMLICSLLFRWFMICPSEYFFQIFQELL